MFPFLPQLIHGTRPQLAGRIRRAVHELADLRERALFEVAINDRLAIILGQTLEGTLERLGLLGLTARR